MNSVRTVAREANDISRYQAHQIMRDLIVYKSYTMLSVQQMYNEDMDLRVKLSERFLKIKGMTVIW